MTIDLSFFEQDTVKVAEQLLGCYLVRTLGSEQIVVRITETEAYKGADDPASHAYRGKTARNEVMFGRAGRLYVYFIYGLHYCINIVTESAGVPGAVLLRGAEPVEGIERIKKLRGNVSERQLLNGPGKLAQALAIDRSFNGYDLLEEQNHALRVMPRSNTTPIAYTTTGRIGISRAQHYPWRFVLDKSRS